VDRGVEKVVFDLKGTVFEKECPCNWQSLAKLADYARLKPIFGRFTAGRLLAVKAVTDGDEGGIGIELEFDCAACALSCVLSLPYG
jgi:hypothetical protein